MKPSTCCKKCGGKLKLLEISQIVQSRHPERPRISVSGVPVHKCTICGKQRLTPEGETLLSVVKRSNLKEMQERQMEVQSSPFEAFGMETLPAWFNQMKRIFSVK